jgi:hypothetical protein
LRPVSRLELLRDILQPKRMTSVVDIGNNPCAKDVELRCLTELLGRGTISRAAVQPYLCK